MVLSALYAGLCLLLFCVQRSFLYFPSHDAPTGALTAWIEDGQTIGYCREVAQPRMVWLMMHGNGGQASDRDYVLPHMSPRDSLYVVEYPGYGVRSGIPCRDSFNRAASEAYIRLAEKHPTTPLGVIGESIGSGPASTLAAAERTPDKIVLLVPFNRLADVAARRFFFVPVRLLLLDRWDNAKALSSYRGNVEIIAAEQDSIIPPFHAVNLARACPQAKLFMIPGGHNDWSRYSQVKIEP